MRTKLRKPFVIVAIGAVLAGSGVYGYGRVTGGTAQAGTANAWMNAAGQTCTRSASPISFATAQANGWLCGTLADAWSAAQAGDTIRVADGDYTTGCNATTGKASDTTIIGGSGARFICAVGGANSGVDYHMILDGVTMQYFRAEGNFLTVQNATVTCQDSAPWELFYSDGGTTGAPLCNSKINAAGSNITYRNVTVGPQWDSSGCNGVWESDIPKIFGDHVLMQNVWFHDLRYSHTNCGGDQQHSENLRVEGGSGPVTLSGVVFSNGANSGSVSAAGVINGLGPDTGDLFLNGLMTDFIMENSYCYGVAQGNGCMLVQSTSSFAGTSGWRNNIFFVDGLGAVFDGNVTGTFFTNNILLSDCPDTTGARGNVTLSSGASCGAGNTSTAQDTSSVFNDYAGHDYTQKAGSATIDAGSSTAGDYSSTDKNGVARYCGTKPDAGPYEKCP